MSFNPDFCYAHQAGGGYRNRNEEYKGHKPIPGLVYDGEPPITTCAWCGVRLETVTPL